jgi:hypothetical protein
MERRQRCRIRKHRRERSESVLKVRPTIVLSILYQLTVPRQQNATDPHMGMTKFSASTSTGVMPFRRKYKMALCMLSMDGDGIVNCPCLSVSCYPSNLSQLRPERRVWHQFQFHKYSRPFRPRRWARLCLL